MANKIPYLSFIIAIQLTMRRIDGFNSVSSGSYAAQLSSNANLSCTVTDMTFMGWKSPDGRIVTASSLSRIYVKSTGSRNDLIIKNVQKSDKGIYRCVTSSEALPVTLHVVYGPSVLLAQTTTDTQWSSYTSPEQVELQCGFDGYPVPFVELSKDGKLIQTAISSLTYAFNAKSIDDFGFYACSARNKYGEANHFIEVAKLGPPDPPANVTVRFSCHSVQVDWLPPISDRGRPITSYRVELLRGGNVIAGEVLGFRERTYAFLDLAKSTIYKVRVNCKNSEGRGLWEIRSFKSLDVCGTAFTSTSWLALHIVSLVIAWTIQE